MPSKRSKPRSDKSRMHLSIIIFTALIVLFVTIRSREDSLASIHSHARELSDKAFAAASDFTHKIEKFMEAKRS